VKSKLNFVIVIAALSMPAYAHHSIFMNPHSWVYMSVAGDDGEATIWSLETGSVRALERAGIANNTLAPGDKVSVRCHQLKDGANGCLLGFLKPPGGVETEWD